MWHTRIGKCFSSVAAVARRHEHKIKGESARPQQILERFDAHVLQSALAILNEELALLQPCHMYFKQNSRKPRI